jgi:sugar lactone lactonase YvrE
MRRSISTLLTLAISCFALASCKDDGSSPVATGPDGGTSVPPQQEPPPAPPPLDAGVPDAEAGAPTVNVLAQFDMSKGELPEGLWEIGPDAVGFIGKGGTPITAWAPAAAPVTIAGGKATAFGSLSSTPKASYTLGVITDAAGAIYFAVAPADAPPNDPVPGIYKMPAGGGAATVFSAPPAMAFPNGLDFIGAELFVTDSGGAVYKIDPSGAASVWSQDPLLAPSTSACGGQVPLPIGANGIVHDASNVYVTNTDYGRIVKIPIQANGSAGTATVLKEDCTALVGADGLLVDPKDGSLIVALNVKDEIVRVAKDGSTISVIASGKPLANPASLILEDVGGKRRLLVTNPAFFKKPGDGSPNLAEVILP